MHVDAREEGTKRAGCQGSWRWFFVGFGWRWASDEAREACRTRLKQGPPAFSGCRWCWWLFGGLLYLIFWHVSGRDREKFGSLHEAWAERDLEDCGEL